MRSPGEMPFATPLKPWNRTFSSIWPRCGSRMRLTDLTLSVAGSFHQRIAKLVLPVEAPTASSASRGCARRDSQGCSASTRLSVDSATGNGLSRRYLLPPRPHADIYHQAPRSASRYDRTLANAKILPSAIISVGVLPSKMSFGVLTHL